MVTGPDALVLFPWLNSPFRTAFQVHVRRMVVQAHQGEHFVHHFEDQHILSEGEAFGDTWFRKAGFSDLFDVHL